MSEPTETGSEVYPPEHVGPSDPADEAFLAPLIAKTREAFGEAEFLAAETAGRALGYEDAMAEARRWLASAN